MEFPNQIYIANDPYLTFSQEYTKKHYGLNLMEVSAKTNEAWNKLTSREKRLYQIRNYDHEEPYPVENQSDSDTSCGINRRSRAKSCSTPAKPGLRRKPRNASMPTCPPKMTRSAPMPSCEPKSAAKSRYATKPSCAPKKMKQCAPKKRRCAPVKAQCEPTKSRRAPTKKRCAPRRKNVPKRRCAPKRRSRRCATKCQKPGPVTNNGYLNFLREYRKKHCGLKPRDLVMRAARAWCRLTEAQKCKYRGQAARHQKPRSCK